MSPSAPVSYVNTRTRMFLVRADASFTIHHANRQEDVTPGTMFGFDVSKRGDVPVVPLLMGDGAPLWRRIGDEALRDCRWEEDPSAPDASDLLASVATLMSSCSNESYRTAWAHMRELVRAGARAAVYQQTCGIKAVVAVLDTVTDHARTAYARLLTESNGTTTVAKPFDATHARRYLVCEPFRSDGGGGFPMDETGARNEDGALRGTSVYQKPEADVARDWYVVERAEAERVLRETGRALPHDQIRILQAKIAWIRDAPPRPWYLRCL